MSQPTLLQRIKELPVLFPLVALFHVVMFAITTYGFARDGVLDTVIGGGSATEWLLSAALWIGVCFWKRWAAIGYIVMTVANMALLFLTPLGSVWRSISGTLFPFDALMGLILLFYYKRFR